MDATNFTADQKEKIVEAVAKLCSENNLFYFAKFVNQLTSAELINSVECTDPDNSNEKEINLMPDYFESLVMNNTYLQDFFFELEEAKNYRSITNSVMH